jgi:transcriptional regulator with XRE-family HTH domain
MDLHVLDAVRLIVIGPTIQELRRSRKISRQDLAGRLAAMGITIDRSAIARLENRDRRVLDYQAIAIAIAQSLQVPIQRLFEKREQGKPRRFSARNFNSPKGMPEILAAVE